MAAFKNPSIDRTLAADRLTRWSASFAACQPAFDPLHRVNHRGRFSVGALIASDRLEERVGHLNHGTLFQPAPERRDGRPGQVPERRSVLSVPAWIHYLTRQKQSNETTSPAAGAAIAG